MELVIKLLRDVVFVLNAITLEVNAVIWLLSATFVFRRFVS
jgi:hypothetical protein